LLPPGHGGEQTYFSGTLLRLRVQPYRKQETVLDAVFPYNSMKGGLHMVMGGLSMREWKYECLYYTGQYHNPYLYAFIHHYILICSFSVVV
jgi:hypothetical protein